MNDEIDFDEWEQRNDEMDLEDQRQDFYEQLQGWVQKNVEVRKMSAEVNAEYRFLRDYAQSNRSHIHGSTGFANCSSDMKKPTRHMKHYCTWPQLL